MGAHDDAIRGERERIGREIHDVLGHRLTVVALHAGAMEGIPGTPDAVRAALEVIRRTATDGLRDLRGVLDALDAEDAPTQARDPRDHREAPDPRKADDPPHTDDPHAAAAPPSRPSPLEQLDTLISGVALAGLRVELRIGGRPRPVDREVASTAIRIVQEALTNSLRHGGATDGRVILRYEDDAVTVEIVDNGRGEAPVPVTPRIHRGLRGMHHRVTRVCGDLQVGPLPAGGFRVWARLPRFAPATQVPA